MKVKNYSESYQLSSEKIDVMSGRVSSFLETRKIEKKERLKLRLSMENALLRWQEEFGDDAVVELSLRHGLGRETIILTHKGESCNPLDNTDDEVGTWAKSLQSSLMGVPTYDYLGKKNIVQFFAKAPSISRLLLILIFLGLGVAIGILGLLFIPEASRTAFCNGFLSPMYEAFLGVFNFCGIPLIFLSVLTGILGVGNVNSFNIIGRKMVRYFMTITILSTILAIAVAPIIFPQQLGGNGPDVKYGDFLEMVLGWIPKGLFQPFIECNAMQLVILGVALGVAILLIDGGQGYASGFFSDFNLILLKIMSWLTYLIPLFLMLTLIKSMWMNEMSLIISAWKSWVVTTGLQLLVIILIACPLTRGSNVSLRKVMKKVGRVFLIACGSCTCTVSIPENYDCCENRLGIDYRVFVFGIPIGTSVFKPATAIRVVILCCFVSWSNHISVSIGWFIMLFVMAIIMSIATPAIPGGTLMLAGMLFSQLGLPQEFLGQMLTTDVFFDCVCIAFNQIAVSIGLASYSRKIDLLNEDILEA